MNKYICITFVAVFANLATSEWVSDSPFATQKFVDFGGVRGLFVDEFGDVLAVGRLPNIIAALYEEENEDGTITAVKTTLVDASGLSLNHGITWYDGYLYASSGSTVYRWPYTPGSRTEITESPEVVISDIPDGHHITRTLIFGSDGTLYVSVGSGSNVDADSTRSRINRFDLSQPFPIDFNSGEVFADGLRNEVGLAWDLNGVLHGVENGADNLNRDDLGGDIHNGNPSEEMNRFDQPSGTHYGYPYCWTVYDLPDHGVAGDQYAWPSFMDDGVHDDDFCRDVSMNHPPLIPMPAHHAPLGLEFYRGQNCGVDGGFPCEAVGDAFVAFHGSWNSDIPVGYKVTWFNFESGNPDGVNTTVVYESDTDNCRQCFRPVNAVFNHNGHLFVSDDAGSQVLKIVYGEITKPITNVKEN